MHAWRSLKAWNVGAVAAVGTGDGAGQWQQLYKQRGDECACHVSSPCGVRRRSLVGKADGAQKAEAGRARARLGRLRVRLRLRRRLRLRMRLRVVLDHAARNAQPTQMHGRHGAPVATHAKRSLT